MISTTVISYSEKQSTIGSTCHMKDRIPTGSRLSHLNSRSLTESGQLCLFQFICVTFLSPPLPTLPFWHLCLCDCNTPNHTEVGIHSCPPPPSCCCSYTKSCPALWDTMDYSPPDSSVHGILKARTLEWVPFLLRGSGGIEPISPASQADALQLSPPGSLTSRICWELCPNLLSLEVEESMTYVIF